MLKRIGGYEQASDQEPDEQLAQIRRARPGAAPLGGALIEAPDGPMPGFWPRLAARIEGEH